MTLFAKLLKYYIDSSGHSIYQLAKRSGMNRTSIHKAISEDRLPHPDSLKELEKCLNLTPEEHRQFWESYEMAFYGESVFYRRQSVLRLISSLALTFFEQKPISWPSYSGSSGSLSHLLPSKKLYHSPYEFSQLFFHILKKEAGNAEGVENKADSLPILISFAQAPPPYIFDCFASFFSAGTEKRLQVQQIIHFIKNPDTAGKPSYNLELLSRYLPYIFINREHYEVYYCYRESLTESLYPELFPSYMVFRTCILLFSGDFQTIWVESNEELLSYYRNIFHRSAKEACHLSKYFYNFNQLDTYFQSFNRENSSFASLEYLPSYPLLCNGHMLSQDIVHKQEFSSLEENTSYFFKALDRWRAHFSSISHVTSIFCADSLMEFARTGFLSGIPRSFIRPLTAEERLLYLEELKNACSQGEYIIRAAPSSGLSLSPRLSIFLHGDNSISFGFLDTKKESWYYISIVENTIVDSFYDFIEASLTNRLFLSKEETIGLIQEAELLVMKDA
ncbi:helix-turn-helix domain-containing protein [Lachnospiraceae bacterium 62-35]